MKLTKFCKNITNRLPRSLILKNRPTVGEVKELSTPICSKSWRKKSSTMKKYTNKILLLASLPMLKLPNLMLYNSEMAALTKN